MNCKCYFCQEAREESHIHDNREEWEKGPKASAVSCALRTEIATPEEFATYEGMKQQLRKNALLIEYGEFGIQTRPT